MADFESMAGSLSHAAAVVYGGRWFLRPWWKARARLEKALQGPRGSLRRRASRALRIHLGEDVLASIEWWQQALEGASE